MKTNRAIIRGINWILASIISMLGFVGCGKIGAEEYGTPHADYTIKGAVVDKTTGKPIKGIRVGYSPKYWAVAEYGVLPTPYEPKVHVLTDAKGEFKLTDRFYVGEYQVENGNPILNVSVEDIDGVDNGLFQSEYIQVDFSDAEHSGKSKSWYSGEYSLNVNVELTGIEDEENQ